jgi:hypothetical protein
MTLSENIQSTLDSGFVVESIETGIRIQKTNDTYYLQDRDEQLKFTEWSEIFSYFIKCHFLELQKKYEDSEEDN